MYFGKGNWIEISNLRVFKVPRKGFCANFQKTFQVISSERDNASQGKAAHMILPMCLVPLLLVTSLACGPTVQVNWGLVALGGNDYAGPCQLAENCKQQLSSNNVQQHWSETNPVIWRFSLVDPKLYTFNVLLIKIPSSQIHFTFYWRVMSHVLNTRAMLCMICIGCVIKTYLKIN